YTVQPGGNGHLVGVTYASIDFEDPVTFTTTGVHTITVQAKAGTAGSISYDPNSNQTLRVVDYSTFGSFGGSTVSATEYNTTYGTATALSTSLTQVGGLGAANGGLNPSVTVANGPNTVRLQATVSVFDNVYNSYGFVTVKFLID